MMPAARARPAASHCPETVGSGGTCNATVLTGELSKKEGEGFAECDSLTNGQLSGPRLHSTEADVRPRTRCSVLTLRGHPLT